MDVQQLPGVGPTRMNMRSTCLFLANTTVTLSILLSTQFANAVTMRIIVEDYDAKLSPVAAAGGSGKVERKLYKEGDSKLTVKCMGVDVPDGIEMEVVVGGSVVGKIIVTGGSGKLSVESRAGDYVPQVRAGDKVALQYNGGTILSGNFVPD